MFRSCWQTLKCQMQNLKMLLTINIQASLSLHFCVCCLWKFVGKVSGNSSIRVCRVSAASTDQSEARICVDQWESWRWLGHHSGPVTVSSELFYSREGFSPGPASPINQYWEGSAFKKAHLIVVGKVWTWSCSYCVAINLTCCCQQSYDEAQSKSIRDQREVKVHQQSFTCHRLSSPAPVSPSSVLES